MRSFLYSRKSEFPIKKKIDTYQALYEEFMEKREKYLLEREGIIDKLLYEEHTLQKVKEICNK